MRPPSMNTLQAARNQVLQQIDQACQQANRATSSVNLLAVSKTHPAEILKEMYETGQRAFGENYLQEALDKIEALADLDIEWHFIGSLQRNKVKFIVPFIDCIHSVDSSLAPSLIKWRKSKNCI